MRRFLILALLAGAVAVHAADAGKGKEAYGKSCALCHGKDGKGNASMAKVFKVELSALDLTDKHTLDKKDDELTGVTAKGKGKMPAFAGKLKEEEVSAVVAYFRSLGGAKGDAAAARAATKTGTKAYAAKCASCHGKDGEGSPAMAKMFKVENAVLDLTDEATLGMKDEELTALIAKGKRKMPAFSGKLKEEEMADLVRYFRSLGGKKAEEKRGKDGKGARQ